MIDPLHPPYIGKGVYVALMTEQQGRPSIHSRARTDVPDLFLVDHR